MAIGKRLFLFLFINLAVILSLSILLSLLGVNHYITANGIDFTALLIFCSVFGMGGAFISLWISKPIAKWTMKIKIISPQSPGQFADLVNSVHTLAKAAKLPKMPEVGIYESPEINAFATGPSKSNSLVAVSTGLLESMDQEQTMGVLAHEVAHIANGDMVTMTLIQGVVNTFVMVLARVIAFAVSSAFSRDSEEGIGQSPFMHMMIVFALEMLLMPIGMIVVAHFSRIREFRADKGSATINGRQGMIAALKALQVAQARAYASSSSTHASMSSLQISNRPSKVSLFSTHPSLEDRIRALGGK